MKASSRLLLGAALIAAAWLAREVLLLAFVGVVIAVVFSFPVGWLSRWMPRSVAVILVLLALAGASGAFVALVAPSLTRQVSELRASVPRAIREARSWLYQVQPEENAQKIEEKAGEALDKAGEKALPALFSVVSSATAVLLVIVLGAFLVSEPDTYRRGLRRLMPRRREAAFDETWRRLGEGLRGWVGGVLVAMTLMGTLTAAGLAIAGIKGWFLLGLLTFLGTFVPYVGAVASAIPGILAGLSQSPQHALYAAIIYLGVHVVEGYLVEPLVMRRAIEIKPALLLVTQGAMAAIFGVLGTIVATPMLACAQVAVEYLWSERALKKPAPETAQAAK